MGRESRANHEFTKMRAQVTDHQLLMAVCSVLNRGFWGRFKWLVLGR